MRRKKLESKISELIRVMISEGSPTGSGASSISPLMRSVAENELIKLGKICIPALEDAYNFNKPYSSNKPYFDSRLIHVLGQIRSPKSIPIFEKALGHRELRVRNKAAKALCSMKAWKSKYELIKSELDLMTTESYESSGGLGMVQKVAIARLENLGNDGLSVLMKALKAGKHTELIIEVLSQKTINEIEKTLLQNDPKMNESAANVLKQIKVLKGDDVIINYASEKLGEIDNISAVPKLIQLLENDKFKNSRTSVIKTLGKIGDVMAVEPLTKILQDKHEDTIIRETVAWALGEIGDIRAEKPLIDSILNLSVLKPSLYALAKLPNRSRNTLVLYILLMEYSERIREWKSRKYSNYGPGQIALSSAIEIEDELITLINIDAEVFIKAIKDQLYSIYSFDVLIKVCGKAKCGESVDVLKGILFKKNEFKFEAISALGEISSREAIIVLCEYLINAVNNEYEEKNVLAALTKNSDIVMILCNFLSDNKVIKKEVIYRTLGKLADIKAIEPILESIKNNSTTETTIFAIESLAKIGIFNKKIVWTFIKIYKINKRNNYINSKKIMECIADISKHNLSKMPFFLRNRIRRLML